MLRYRLIHPEILAVLASSGHGSRVLIADGHYPFATAAGPNATHVFLNLAPGRLTVTEVLDALIDAIAVEAAAVMQPPPELPTPESFADFSARLPDLELERLDRFDFYAAAKGDDVALVIATGDTRTYANLMLTIGVAQKSQ